MINDQNQKDENKGRLAQPASEEIKLHGDQLAKEVRAAAGSTIQNDDKAKEKTSSGDRH